MDLSRQVSAEIPVSQASKAIEKLSAQINIPLRAVGPVANEVIFLHVNNRPICEVLDHVATATKGVWTKKDDGTFTLSRPQYIVEQEERRLLSERVNEFEKWRTARSKCLSSPFDKEYILQLGYKYLRSLTNDEDESSSEYLGRDPMYRAFARCIQGLDPNSIASLDPNQKLVFSTMPTRSQRTLPASILSQLLDEQALWSKTLKTINWNNEQGKQLRDFQVFETDYPIRSSFENIDPFKDAYLITVALWHSEEDTLSTEFRLLSAKGKEIVVFRDEFLLRPDTDREVPHDLKRIPLPQSSKSTVAFWSPFGNEKHGLSEVEARKEIFGFASNREPLTAGHQELLSNLALKTNKSVIACIPDEAASQNLSVDFDLYFQVIYTPWDYRLSSNWIELFPKDYTTHWRTRVQRSRIASVVNSYRNGQINLREYASLYCGEPGYPSQSLLADTASKAMKLLGMREKVELTGLPNQFHLFASLTDAQLSRMAKGEIIPYRELSPNQLSLAKNIVFGQSYDLLVGGTAPTPFAETDATFELPNGIFDGPGIGLEVADDDIYSISGLDVRSQPQTFIQSIAERKEQYVAGRGRCGFGVTQPTLQMLFELRKQRRMTLRCYLSSKHWFAADFQEPVRATDGIKRRFNSLPNETRERIRNTGSFVDLKEMREKLVNLIKKLEDFADSENAQNVIKDLRKTIDDIDRQLADPPSQ